MRQRSAASFCNLFCDAVGLMIYRAVGRAAYQWQHPGQHHIFPVKQRRSWTDALEVVQGLLPCYRLTPQVGWWAEGALAGDLTIGVGYCHMTIAPTAPRRAHGRVGGATWLDATHKVLFVALLVALGAALTLPEVLLLLLLLLLLWSRAEDGPAGGRAAAVCGMALPGRPGGGLRVQGRGMPVGHVDDRSVCIHHRADCQALDTVSSKQQGPGFSGWLGEPAAWQLLTQYTLAARGSCCCWRGN